EWIFSGHHIHRGSAARVDDRIGGPTSQDLLQHSPSRSGNVVRDGSRKRVPDVVVGWPALAGDWRFAERHILAIAGRQNVVEGLSPGVGKERLQTKREPVTILRLE